MAIYYPDIERETYKAAVFERNAPEARDALREVVRVELEHGCDRDRILSVLDQLADELGAEGMTGSENAVLDVMDAMVGWAHPTRRI